MAVVAPPQPFEHLVLDFLAYLEFERGLARNTLQAYRTDLLQYGVFLAQRDASAADASAADVSD
ncbi:MAG: site-specific integrase, partial [Solirubrobacteraceae bacterium]